MKWFNCNKWPCKLNTSIFLLGVCFFRYSILLTYNFALGYPLASYFEYTVLVLQGNLCTWMENYMYSEFGLYLISSDLFFQIQVVNCLGGYWLIFVLNFNWLWYTNGWIDDIILKRFFFVFFSQKALCFDNSSVKRFFCVFNINV